MKKKAEEISGQYHGMEPYMDAPAGSNDAYAKGYNAAVSYLEALVEAELEKMARDYGQDG